MNTLCMVCIHYLCIHYTMVITFTLRKKRIVSTCYVNHTAMERVSEMRDLGIILDSKLTFGPHIDGVASSGGRTEPWACISLHIVPS